jgi:hypothetical protein
MLIQNEETVMLLIRDSILTLKMKTGRSFETILSNHHTAQCNNTEKHELYHHRCENLKSGMKPEINNQENRNFQDLWKKNKHRKVENIFNKKSR